MIRYRFRFAIEARKDFMNPLDIVKRIFISNFELCKFSKRYKFSSGPALPFGWASESEYLDVFFTKREEEDYVRDIVEKNLPEGVRLLEFKTIPVYFPSVESCVDVVEVMIKGKRGFSDILFEGLFGEIIYDVIKKENTLTLFYYYRKTTREVLKNLMDLLAYDGGIESIVRKNIFWFDSKLNLRVF